MSGLIGPEQSIFSRHYHSENPSVPVILISTSRVNFAQIIWVGLKVRWMDTVYLQPDSHRCCRKDLLCLSYVHHLLTYWSVQYSGCSGQQEYFCTHKQGGCNNPTSSLLEEEDEDEDEEVLDWFPSLFSFFFFCFFLL